MFHKLTRSFFLSYSLAVSLAAALLFSIVPLPNHQTAYASGLLSLSVSEGPVGTLAKFTGSGFISNMIVKLYFSSVAGTTGNALDNQISTYEFLGDFQTDSQGSIGQSGAFAIPSNMDDGSKVSGVSNGDYYIYITYSGSKYIQARATFFVTGPVTLLPNTGRIGDYISISGKNLKPDEMVFIYFSSNKAAIGSTIGTQVTSYQQVGTFAVTSDGILNNGGIAYKIPNRLADGTFPEDVHGGDYFIYLTYATARKQVAMVSRFTILNGEISLEPLTGSVGSEIQITGSGLRANQNITVKYDNDLVVITSGDAATDSTGQFSSKIVIPESTIGSHQIVVTDVTGNHPEAWYTVEPSCVVTSPVTAGSQAEIKGYGFSEGQKVTLSINDQTISTTPATILTNYNGSFKGSFMAPSYTGSVTLVAIDKLNVIKEVEFTVAAIPPTKALISLFPVNSQANPGFVGKPLTVNGSGFTPNSPVTITYENTPAATYPNIQTNAEGSFQYSFEIPKGTSGLHNIEVTDGINSTSASFILENTPPSPPIALIPEIVSGVKPTTKFDWSDVEDESGVTYIFQVSPDTTFSQIVLEKSGLAASEYAMKENERLVLKGRQTAYYWRVSAVDGAGNASTWSNAILFYVGSAKTAFPVWAIYLLSGLGVIAIVVVAVWLVRVRKNQGK